MGFVLVGGGITTGQLVRGKWKHGSTFYLTSEHVDLGHVTVKFLHQVFSHEIGPSLLVGGVLQDRGHNIIVDEVQVIQNLGIFAKYAYIFGQLKEHDMTHHILGG